MRTNIRRGLAATATTTILAVAGAAMTIEPATALGVAVAWDDGTNITLDGTETAAVVADGVYASGPLCSTAVDIAAQAGILFPDWARSTCAYVVSVCAHQARDAGRAYSGARFYASQGEYRCLVV